MPPLAHEAIDGTSIEPHPAAVRALVEQGVTHQTGNHRGRGVAARANELLGGAILIGIGTLEVAPLAPTNRLFHLARISAHASRP